ncbi:MAG: GNAT family N-acetyltransferase [Pseudomonadota bacterium]
MNTVNLRTQLRASDRQSIGEITASSGFFTPAEVKIALSVFDDAMSGAEDYRYILAESDGKVVGYACFGHDEQTIDSYELYWIAVSDTQRGKGIGKLLLGAVEARITADGGGRLYIETAGRDQYLPTRRFYEEQGYDLVANLEDYYAPGDARVIYARRAPPPSSRP